MATDDKSASGRDAPPPEKQDQSIKARKSSLFEGPGGVTGTTQRFSEYVKVVPATPMSMGMKATLGAIAAVVVLLLLAALFTGHGLRRHHRARRAAVTDARPHVALALARAGDEWNAVVPSVPQTR